MGECYSRDLCSWVLAVGAGITVRWVFSCEIAGPNSMFSFCWFCQCGIRNGDLSCHSSPGDRKGQRTVLFLTTLPALDKSVVISSTGRKYIALVHISSINNKVGRPFACLLANSIPCVIFFSHLLPIFSWVACLVLNVFLCPLIVIGAFWLFTWFFKIWQQFCAYSVRYRI